eukprot:96490_1
MLTMKFTKYQLVGAFVLITFLFVYINQWMFVTTRTSGPINPIPMRRSMTPMSPISMRSMNFAVQPSGWDANAKDIYTQQRRALQNRLFHDANQTVLVHRQIPPMTSKIHVIERSAARSAHRWADIAHFPPQWEPETYQIYFDHIDHDTILIDFGTSFGATILYGVQLADSAYGIEGDPAAFAEIEMNVKLNSDQLWYQNIHLQPACVCTKNETENEDGGIVTMRSARPGNNCAGIADKVGCGDVNFTWNVQCYTLNYLLTKWGIWRKVMEAHKKLFIKIDVESYECKLFPDFYPWLSSIDEQYLPTFYVSYHPQISRCTEEEYNGLFQVASLYKLFICIPFSDLEETIHLDNEAFLYDKIKECTTTHGKSSVFILTNL